MDAGLEQAEPSQPIRPDGLTEPHPDRFPPDHPAHAACLAAHETAMAAGSSGYLDPVSGLFVMTATHLLGVGHCCDRGCRHCPYIGATIERAVGSATSDDMNDEESSR